jgi:murein DD-endopeptidase MepM/ murein hydrolase activator NlpD
MMEAAGERWRRTLRARIAVLAEAPSAGPIRSTGRARSAGPPSATGPDHKRAIAPDLKLDRKLLRLAASDASRPAEPRRLEPAAVLPTRFWPIAGEPLVLGPRELTIATAIDQVVSSPVSGRVVFAEPFRGLGPLLIIDLGRGYHAVLAGLARLDVRRGASVVAGQSLGEIVPRTDGPARLQLELRHRGLPIDPMPWLVAYHDKVRS